MVNIIDIAKYAGVSKTTVSKVLNDQYGVSEETRKIVREAAKVLNYTPNHAARSLVTNRTGVIGVIYDSFDTPIYMNLANHIEGYSQNNGYNAVFCNCNDSFTAKTKYVNYFMGGAADSLIFFGSSRQDRELIIRLKEAQYPFVVIENHFDDLDINNILVDNTEGAARAVNYLIKMGHKKIAHITGDITHRVSSDRLNGYIRALQDANLDFVPEYVIYANAKAESGTEAIKKLIELEDRPTAIFAFNDIQAYEVIGYLFKHGYRVPNDFSIIGFDNISEILNFIPRRVMLTSMQQPLEQIAKASIEILLENMKDVGMLPRKEIFETVLVEGESCDRPLI